ncbi:hypothetical protein M758_UG022400 [Ceratodon purpureus]|nr:hypothetical protein M758_UG022400 [Ceratodon purpureus]
MVSSGSSLSLPSDDGSEDTIAVTVAGEQSSPLSVEVGQASNIPGPSIDSEGAPQIPAQEHDDFNDPMDIDIVVVENGASVNNRTGGNSLIFIEIDFVATVALEVDLGLLNDDNSVGAEVTYYDINKHETPPLHSQVDSDNPGGQPVPQDLSHSHETESHRNDDDSDDLLMYENPAYLRAIKGRLKKGSGSALNTGDDVENNTFHSCKVHSYRGALPTTKYGESSERRPLEAECSRKCASKDVINEEREEADVNSATAGRGQKKIE